MFRWALDNYTTVLAWAVATLVVGSMGCQGLYLVLVFLLFAGFYGLGYTQARTKYDPLERTEGQ